MRKRFRRKQCCSAGILRSEDRILSKQCESMHPCGTDTWATLRKQSTEFVLNSPHVPSIPSAPYSTSPKNRETEHGKVF